MFSGPFTPKCPGKLASKANVPIEAPVAALTTFKMPSQNHHCCVSVRQAFRDRCRRSCVALCCFVDPCGLDGHYAGEVGIQDPRGFLVVGGVFCSEKTRGSLNMDIVT